MSHPLHHFSHSASALDKMILLIKDHRSSTFCLTVQTLPTYSVTNRVLPARFPTDPSKTYEPGGIRDTSIFTEDGTKKNLATQYEAMSTAWQPVGLPASRILMLLSQEPYLVSSAANNGRRYDDAITGRVRALPKLDKAPTNLWVQKTPHPHAEAFTRGAPHQTHLSSNAVLWGRSHRPQKHLRMGVTLTACQVLAGASQWIAEVVYFQNLRGGFRHIHVYQRLASDSLKQKLA